MRKPKRFPWNSVCIAAESYVVTVSGCRSLTPPPSIPTGTPRCRDSTPCHCAIRSSVGTTTKVGRFTWAMASTASSVLPAPVGSSTSPRPPAPLHASSAARWWGKGSMGVASATSSGSKRFARSS